MARGSLGKPGANLRSNPQGTQETASRLECFSHVEKKTRGLTENPQMKKSNPTSLLCKDYLAAKTFTPPGNKEGIFLQRNGIKLYGQLVYKLTLQSKAFYILKLKDPKVYWPAPCPLTLQWTKKKLTCSFFFSLILFFKQFY